MSKLTLSPRIRLTPFHQRTEAAGMTDVTVYNKMILPTSYGDPDAEYDRLMNRVAIWDVSAERQVQIEGPDADACAQYLTARDISLMQEGQGKYVAMCDHDGRILNDPVLLKLSGNRYWFSLADNDMLIWCKAVAAERGFDVKVTEPDVSPLAIQGPKALPLAVDLFGEVARSLKFFGFVETHLNGIPLVLCRSGWSKQGGFELFLQDSARGIELWDQVVAAGAPYGIGPGAPNPVERVESGLLSWGGDTTPDSNPFEAGMDRFVDVETAVDYVGKYALSQVFKTGAARKLVGLEVDLPARAAQGWPIAQRTPVFVNDELVGTLSALVYSPRLGKTIGLAQIDAVVCNESQSVQIQGPGKIVSAHIVGLPFK